MTNSQTEKEKMKINESDDTLKSSIPNLMLTPFFLSLLIPFMLAAGYTTYFQIPIFFGIPSLFTYVLSKGLPVIIVLSLFIIFIFVIAWSPVWIPDLLRTILPRKSQEQLQGWMTDKVQPIKNKQSKGIFKFAIRVFESLKPPRNNRNKIVNLYIYIVILAIFFVEVFWFANFTPPGKLGLFLQIGFILLLCVLAAYIIKQKNQSEEHVRNRFFIIMPILLMFISFGAGLHIANLSDNLYLTTYKIEEGTDNYSPYGECKDGCSVVFIDNDKAYIIVGESSNTVITKSISDENRLVIKE